MSAEIGIVWKSDVGSCSQTTSQSICHTLEHSLGVGMENAVNAPVERKSHKLLIERESQVNLFGRNDGRLNEPMTTPNKVMEPLHSDSTQATRGFFHGEISQDAASFETSAWRGYTSLDSSCDEQQALLSKDVPSDDHGRSIADDDGSDFNGENEEYSGGTLQSVRKRSTIYQTTFNSINVLVGVGLLSLPMAFMRSGWLLGLGLLVAAAGVTRYTAGILADCLDDNDELISFVDIASACYGKVGRIFTTVLLFTEIMGICVAMIILFADTMQTLAPGLSLLYWKIICGMILVPLSCLPLRSLSFVSIIGVICCMGTFSALLTAGFSRDHAPGSLREPAHTTVFPQGVGSLLIGIGLIMSPWGGHGVFPHIYRDFKPGLGSGNVNGRLQQEIMMSNNGSSKLSRRYRYCLSVVFALTLTLDASVGTAGWLMFGNGVEDEITTNILQVKEYARTIRALIATFIAIIPLTKVPLNTCPAVSMLEGMLNGIVKRRAKGKSSGLMNTKSSTWNQLTIVRYVLSTGVTCSMTMIAIVFPGFERTMALIGALCCFTLCITLPLAFQLRLFAHRMTIFRIYALRFAMILSIGISVASTAATILMGRNS